MVYGCTHRFIFHKSNETLIQYSVYQLECARSFCLTTALFSVVLTFNSKGCSLFFFEECSVLVAVEPTLRGKCAALVIAVTLQWQWLRPNRHLRLSGGSIQATSQRYSSKVLSSIRQINVQSDKRYLFRYLC